MKKRIMQVLNLHTNMDLTQNFSKSGYFLLQWRSFRTILEKFSHNFSKSGHFLLQWRSFEAILEKFSHNFSKSGYFLLQWRSFEAILEKLGCLPPGSGLWVLGSGSGFWPPKPGAPAAPPPFPHPFPPSAGRSPSAGRPVLRRSGRRHRQGACVLKFPFRKE